MGKQLTEEKIEGLVSHIISSLAPCSYTSVMHALRAELAGFNLSEERFKKIKRMVFKRLYKLPFKWQCQNSKPPVYSPVSNPSPYELTGAFGENAYSCYFSALYPNELTKQLPSTFYIALPKKSKDRKSVSSYEEMDFDKVRDVFMKKPRESTLAFRFGAAQFVLVERDDIHSIGVIKKEVLQDGNMMTCKMTDTEGTLIDCSIAPHRAGGISAVIEAYKLANDRLDIGKLFSHYSSQHFVYPYWQRIGFLLETAGLKELADKWDILHKGKKQFFLMHGYRASWKYNDRWKLYFPPALNP